MDEHMEDRPGSLVPLLTLVKHFSTLLGTRMSRDHLHN